MLSHLRVASLVAFGLILTFTARLQAYGAELDRAQRELAEADRAWRLTLDDVSRARAAADGLRARRGELAARLGAALRDATELRRTLDASRAQLGRFEADLGRALGEISELQRRAEIGRQRVATAQQNVEITRSRLIADFDQDREMRRARGAVADAQRGMERARGNAIGSMQASAGYQRLAREIAALEDEARYLQRGTWLDRQRLGAVQRAIAENRARLDEMTRRAVDSDPQVRRAAAELNAAECAVSDLRSAFERNLPRHHQMVRAHGALQEEQEKLARAQGDLEEARRRQCSIQEQIDRIAPALAEASRQLSRAEGEIAAAQRELRGIDPALAAAQGQLDRAIACEPAAREARERAARRVALLEHGGRNDDGRRDREREGDRDGRWSLSFEYRNGDGHGERGPRFRDR